MADLLDVETALAALCAATIYPLGINQPSAAGVPCRIYPGWPNESDLAASLASGIADVTIYSGNNLERDTTRYAREWSDLTITTPTLTATVNATIITIGGTITAGHFLTLAVDGTSYSYAALANDTLATVATALAALIPAPLKVSVVGPVITLVAKTQGRIAIRNGAPGVIGREVGRQQRGFMISVWAPSPQSRSAVASLLMSAIRGTDFITLSDGTDAWITYRQSNESDGAENAMAYRRDINIWVEYETLQTAVAYPVTAFGVTEAVVLFDPVIENSHDMTVLDFSATQSGYTGPPPPTPPIDPSGISFEEFTALTNGAQSFTLAAIPTLLRHVWVNGLEQARSSITVSGASVFLPASFQIFAGDAIYISYQH